MTLSMKKLGRHSALAVLFALSAAGGQALAQDNTPATPAAAVAQSINATADIAKQIQMTKHTQEVLGLQNPAEIAALKATLKRSAELTAPRIVLTPGVSAAERQGLIEQYADKVGALPDYLAKINHKTAGVEACDAKLAPHATEFTAALATEVATCAATAPAAAATLAVAPVETPPVKTEAVKPAPIKTTPAETQQAETVAPAPVDPAPVKTAPAPVAKTTSAFDPTAPINLGIEFGAAVLLLGGGAFGIRKLTSKKQTPDIAAKPAEPTPAAPPAPTSATPPRLQDDTPRKKSFEI